MLFSSISFLYVFLPVTLSVYFLVPRRGKNTVLLIASLVFYFFGEPVYVLLLLFSSLSDWAHSLYIEKHRGTKKARAALVSSILINLAMLGFFKYADFILGSLGALLGTDIPLLGIPLPIGISFFTFQTMSYTIDVYRGRVHAQRNPATLATFVCLFPQLIAGPIVRYSDIGPELESRGHSTEGVALGIRRFVFGLGKKVLLANAMGELCSAYLSSGDGSALFAWVYAVAFTLQIYYDFSGYSDMAIGLGRIFGFSFPENFDYPYLSRSVTEFWRRWHMTLGGWFRDYVYIPLGGNRAGKRKWLRNICVVWLLTGLWHGAAWSFVVWGAMFGVLLTAEKLWLLKALQKLPRAAGHIYVMLAVVISFVIFNGESLGSSMNTLGAMFGGAESLASPQAVYCLRSYAVLLVISVIGSTGLPKRLWQRFSGSRAMAVLEPAAVAVLLIAVTASLVDGSFNPFLYFRF